MSGRGIALRKTAAGTEIGAVILQARISSDFFNFLIPVPEGVNRLLY